MKTSKLVLCVLGIALVFTVAAASAADATKLKFKFTKANVPGALQTLPSSINNAGVTVGQYEDSSGVYHGYILKGKGLTTLDDPNGTDTNVQGINFNGAIKVVGYYTNRSTHQSMGFLYTPKNKRFKDIAGPAGAKSSVAEGINDEGSIVGSYVDSSNREHGFVSHGTKYEILDVPGSLATFATDINDMGDIVLGWVVSSGAYKGALFRRFRYTEINVPDTGPLGSFPTGINNKGDITFVWYDSSGLQHGAAYGYKFDYPRAVQTYAGGINDKNALVGFYQDKIGGPRSGYKATYK